MSGPSVRLALATAAMLVGAAWTGPVPAATRPVPRLVVAEVPATAIAADTFRDGTPRAPLGEGGRLVLVEATGRSRVLTAGFHSAADPEVSFDGRRILFAARKTKSDPWCAWEMNADGTGARRITCGAAGVRQPIYQSTIYTLTPTDVEPWVQIAFAGENPGERNEARVGPNTSLWSCKTDGTALRRLTFNLSNDADPVILPDGRMVYAGWLRGPASDRTADRVTLLGVNQDGTDYQAYTGEQGGRVKRSPSPTADGLVVFVEPDAIGDDGAGRLAAVSQTRPLHTYRALSGEGDGVFRAPAPLSDGGLLVSWRRDPRQGLFAIYRMDPATGARERLFERAGWHAIQARAIAARPVPDARSSVVREDDPEGTFYTIDVGINDRGPRFPTGVARALRVLEGVPATAEAPAGTRALGEVPIAGDGSYQVRVPANTPLRLEVLDRDGRALSTSTWLWVRNHDAQGCVGCHEDPERTPPNRLVQALATPAQVLKRPPATLAAGASAAPAAVTSPPGTAPPFATCHAPGGRP